MPSSSCPRIMSPQAGACRHVLPVLYRSLYRSVPAALASGGDDGLVPRLRGGGCPAPHHGGQGKGLAPPGKVPGQLHQVLSHSPPPPSRSLAHALQLMPPHHVPASGGVPTRPSCTLSLPLSLRPRRPCERR